MKKINILMLYSACITLHAMKQEPPCEATKELYDEPTSFPYFSIRPTIDTHPSPDLILISRDPSDRNRLHQNPTQPITSHAISHVSSISIPHNEAIYSAEEDWTDDITVPSEKVLDFNRSDEELHSEKAYLSDISSEEIEESELCDAIKNTQSESTATQAHVDLAELTKRDCGICWENMENAAIKTIVTQCCTNMFHAACLEPCTACPFCNRKLSLAQ